MYINLKDHFTSQVQLWGPRTERFQFFGINFSTAKRWVIIFSKILPSKDPNSRLQVDNFMLKCTLAFCTACAELQIYEKRAKMVQHKVSMTQ